ncbi:hypothetical protein K1719_027836 [Acacia pycnantha]|nr:hypothetical protein K1719_027836 [Acacia pycnantha]
MSFPQPHSSFEIIGGARDRFLPSLTYLSLPYIPSRYIGSNRHVETIFAFFFRSRPKVRYRRQCIHTKDGGVVALDWVSGDDRLFPPNSPVLILLPGLTGGSEASYARHLLVTARSKGWRVVVFNNRGCGNSPVITPQLYSASFLGDLGEVVSHVNTLYPEAIYMPSESHNCPLSGAVALCNPFNLVFTDDNFHKGFNNVYDMALAKGLRKNFKKHALLFEDISGEYNIELVKNAKSIREYDEGLTRVSFGFKSVDEYYSKSSSADSIKYVQTPLLCIQENPNCLLIVTPKGGHLGWVASDYAPFGSPWPDPLVIDFLQHLESGSAKSDPEEGGDCSPQPKKDAVAGNKQPDKKPKKKSDDKKKDQDKKPKEAEDSSRIHNDKSDPRCEIRRLSASVTFLREWRHFQYEPRSIRFACGLGSPEAKDAINCINLPQFSSAAVPEEGLLRDVKSHESRDSLLYVGGPVWALDWCPQIHLKPDSSVKCEFLAVVAHPPGASYHKMGNPLTGRGLVQIWCILNKKKSNGEAFPLSVFQQICIFMHMRKTKYDDEGDFIDNGPVAVKSGQFIVEVLRSENIEFVVAPYEEKAQCWFSKVSQLDITADINSMVSDEDFPK